MHNEDIRSAGLQPLALEEAAEIIGGALAPVDIGDTGPSGGSQNPTPHPDIGIQAAS